MVWQFPGKNLNSLPVCCEGEKDGETPCGSFPPEPTDLRFELNPFVEFNMSNYSENIQKPKPQGRLPSPAPCLPAWLSTGASAALPAGTSAGDPCGFIHTNFCMFSQTGQKHPKCFWDFLMIIPYNLLSQFGSVLLTGNAELKEAVLELLKKPGRKEKTMAWIKNIPPDRNG